MKSLLTLLFVVFGIAMNAQGVCTINSSNASQSFRTICSQGSNPALVNGVFTGDLVVNNVSYTISSADLSAITFSGQVGFRTEFKSHLTFAQAPTVAQGTTVTAEFGKHVHSSITAYGVLYEPNQTGRNYSDFANRMMNGASVIVPGGGGEAMLPISLHEWKATGMSNRVELQWTTDREVNNDYFVVEHSTDGRNFFPLTKLSGAVNSTGYLTYYYRHASPAHGTNYYRLVQYDLDGTATKFSVITAEYQGGTSTPGIYPNPASPGQVVHATVADAAAAISLYTFTGKLVTTTPATGNAGNRMLALPNNLTPGVYVLQIGTHRERLVVR